MISRVFAWTTGVLATALLAYSTFAGAVNIQGMLTQAEVFGLSVTGLGWVFMIAHVSLPVVFFGVALFISRRRNAWVRVLTLGAALTLNALMQLTLTDFETRVLSWQSFFA